MPKLSSPRKMLRVLPFEIPLRERKEPTDEDRATLARLRDLPIDQWHTVEPNPKEKLWKIIDEMELAVRSYFRDEKIALRAGDDTIIRVRQIEVEFETGDIEKLPSGERRSLNAAWLARFGFRPLARNQISTQIYLGALAMKELIMFRLKHGGESPNPFAIAIDACDTTAYVMTLIGNLNMLAVSQPDRARKVKSAKRDQRLNEMLAVVEASKKGEWTQAALAKRFSIHRKTIARYTKLNSRLREALRKS